MDGEVDVFVWEERRREGGSVLNITVSALLMATSGGKKKAGVGRQMINVVDRLAKVDLGNTYDVYLPVGAEESEGWRQSPWVRWHDLPVDRARDRVAWEHWKLAAESKKNQADVFFGTFVALPIPATAPCVSVMHDAFSTTHAQWFPRKQRLILDTLHRHAARKSAVVVTVSEWSKGQICEAYGIRPENVVVAYNGLGNAVRLLTSEELTAIDLSEFLESDEPYLMTVSTLEPRKNLVGLLRGYAEFLKSSNEKPKLLVAGARGWMETDVFTEVQALGLADQVKFLGYVPDLALNALMQKAKLFVLASIVEGFGIPVLEAMTVGTPVAASRTSAIPEVSGDDAFYFDPHQSSDIARGLFEGWTNTGDAQKFSANGLVRAQSFSWDRTIAEIGKAFQQARG